MKMILKKMLNDNQLLLKQLNLIVKKKEKFTILYLGSE